jgi:hypothetical protein
VSQKARRPDLANLVPVPRFLGPRPIEARTVTGVTPQGELTEVAFSGGWTLLLFLSTACDGCLQLWESFADQNAPIADDLAVVLITKRDEPAESVARLAGSTRVVMTETAWSDYEVHSGPFFVVIDGRTDRIATEGVAWSVEQMSSAFASARAEESAT